MSKQQSLPVTPEFVFVHFPATDDRFNGTRTAIVASRGPKWIGLIVLECATLTVTRLDAALEKSCVKPIPATEFNAGRALETFRAMARKMGASKVVCDALGIEWPPVDPTQALAAFTRHAETVARNNLNEEDETMTTKSPAKPAKKTPAKAATKKAPAPKTTKAAAAPKATEKPLGASEVPRSAKTSRNSASAKPAPRTRRDARPAAGRASPSKAPNRKEQLRALLERPAGASLTEMMDATGWQAHSARAALAHFRRDGIEVTKRPDAAGTRYHIAV